MTSGQPLCQLAVWLGQKEMAKYPIYSCSLGFESGVKVERGGRDG